MTSVLVVDDSRFMRTVLDSALTKRGYDVETASTGEEAVDATRTTDFDVVTMDVEMPGMSGIDAVEQIMEANPTPILMLSVYTRDGAEATLDALERGAVDVLPKPDFTGEENLADLVERLASTIDAIANSDVSAIALSRVTASVHRTTRRVGGPSLRHSVSDTALADLPYAADPTVVIGASTGGPQIVEEVLSALPIELDAKVLVVQHMPATFTKRFAARLDEVLEYSVSEAADGDRIGGGEVLVARGGHHLEVATNHVGRLQVRLTEDERVHGVRPAIDVTMKSAAEWVTDPLCGVVLTGMGRDGAAGIEAIHEAGGQTIAQDESTSPVFGIPRRAIHTGSVDHVLPADEIAAGICTAFTDAARPVVPGPADDNAGEDDG